MRQSNVLLVLLGCFWGVSAFVFPFSGTRRVVRSSGEANMTKGFGRAETKPTPPLGAGRGTKSFEKQMRSYRGLKDAGANVVDVYAHQPGGDNKFYFMGRVAHSSEVNVDQALKWHRDLIVDHARTLDPSLKPPLQFFTAPPNSEVAVAKNEHDLCRALAGGGVDLTGIRGQEVGFMPEMYAPTEQPYYCRKHEDGRSLTPPVEVKIDGFPGVV